LEFVAALPLQFYIGPHARKFSVQLGGLHLQPFPDAFAGSGKLLAMVKKFHSDRGVRTSTFVIRELHTKVEMKQFERFLVDEHWLQQENTLSLVQGGSAMPSDGDRARADVRASMWIGRQRGTWKVLAGTMYADHGGSLRDAKSGPSVPTASARVFDKQARLFPTRKADPAKRKLENKKAKEILKLSKLKGNALPKVLLWREGASTDGYEEARKARLTSNRNHPQKRSVPPSPAKLDRTDLASKAGTKQNTPQVNNLSC